MNARLIAKLMTQSYLGSDLGRGHPGVGDNPLGIMSDPEFIALNPGLSQNSQEAGATLLSLSNSSDVIEQLTDYIAQDRAAMDFVNGQTDPWGMKVNPSYKKVKLPRPEWPLLDDYIPETENVCRQNNPAVYFTQLAAPVTTLRKIAEALLDGWPNVQTRCDVDLATGGLQDRTYRPPVVRRPLHARDRQPRRRRALRPPIRGAGDQVRVRRADRRVAECCGRPDDAEERRRAVRSRPG